MATVRVRVPGKVNLALCVGETDAQGYHRLGTIFQAVSLCDEIAVEPRRPGQFRLSFQGEGAPFLPVDDTNLAMRAAKLVASHFGVADAGASISIRKRIPVAGGMAGGSADAAGTLLACSTLWGVNASRDQLRELGAQLGSDVPFLLLGGTAVGEGRGEILRALPARGKYHWVFALAHNGLSTPAVFREFDRVSPPQPTDLPAGLVDALLAGDVARVGGLLTNHLEDAAIRLQPNLQRTLHRGRAAGALGAIVSGSGPTVAFLVADDDHAKRLADELRVFSGVRCVRVAQGPVAGAQVV
ncbi:4-(cytidine 5'-diphospho)-2-C-methyl-D-erythritol kinase [Tessaracoccus sp. OH4464_COT-324]|uniref:4-(cytidine 5'-diphospho)-2-C-methyl-D-erythritol kinase n=1 Tax=Tessaracoccus sp. OH4464_COT-324 TaxID=2491059 RepID=UPI000F644C5B|nr:4-(cytidine 5'-diphospho)-2-C-methyl-D-erythritol kinase [Tessaracoccus sp. OH4464_COT-324]RRD45263.1 4-(cytidine 5'-diphospho)-2-C-methyl-D-erythritol kinase [Tessaracoccus sp. OH4464_COT-324]